MIDLTDRKTLIRYLQSHGLYTKKKLGQNFLVDSAALDKIVEAAELSNDDCVIEVGPGLGVMTEELVGRVKKVIAVELDNVLAELLRERLLDNVISTPSVLAEARNLQLNDKAVDFSSRSESRCRNDNCNNLAIVNSDILRVNIAELTKGCGSYKVVANIPYYITSKIIRFFLEQEKKPETIVLLTQKEVAERICANPGDMSVLSVSVQYYSQPEIVGIVPKTSFFPIPEVDSAILRIVIGRSSAVSCQLCSTNDKRQTTNEFFRCVKIGFASRRKTLLNNLSAGYHLEKSQVLDILVSAGLNDKTRAQELSVEKWQELNAYIYQMLKS